MADDLVPPPPAALPVAEPAPEAAPAPEPALQLRNLSYSYKKRQALNDISLDISRGSIHGFVGPNGAGKTTTLKIVATLLKPQRGGARVFGMDLVREFRQIRRRIGFMPDSFGVYRQMTVFEYLDFFAAAYGLGMARRDRIIKDVLALTDMEERRDGLTKELSRGMQQRLSLARVLVHDPDLLLLDEPASGLDPRARIELMEILRELQRMGKTIFISSHILSELGDLCDSLTIVDRGCLRFSGPISQLLNQSEEITTYLLTLAEVHAPTEQALQALAGVSEVKLIEGSACYRLRLDCGRPDRSNCDSNGDANTILAAALASGGRIIAFKQETRQLGEAFMHLTEPGVPT